MQLVHIFEEAERKGVCNSGRRLPMRVDHGMTRRMCIVPYSSIGFIARVPALIADYEESGVETDEKSGLSIGIVVAEEQKLNRRVVNGDLWFGCAAISASANATSTKGIIKVGTAA